MVSCLFVGVGGFIGSVFRYLIGLVPIKGNELFPINTLLINIAGALVIGIIAALASKMNVEKNLLLFLKTGLCGGFTTFSTFSLDTYNLFKNGHVGVAAIYVVLSVFLCLAVVFAGEIVGGLK
ncbi:MAG: fluoride efflux transporter CrcB [Bacillota bacterium]|nr:fluoride efflux transporter CrcB [Bacillota bacterium]